jgi:hypothetical protein
MLAALLAVPGCTRTDTAPSDNANDGPPGDAPAAEASPRPEQAEPEPDPWQAKLQARVLADSGLGVGGRLSAFDIVNCETGETYCQVCRFGSNPKLMAVGTIDDEDFQEDLQNLDAIAQKYGQKDLKAFAVVTDLRGGKAVTPADATALQEKAKALREKLRISMPIVVPAPGDDGPNEIWDEYYNITKSRTVMFADGRNEVKWNGVGPQDWSGLNEAIVSVVGS